MLISVESHLLGCLLPTARFGKLSNSGQKRLGETFCKPTAAKIRQPVEALPRSTVASLTCVRRRHLRQARRSSATVRQEIH